MSVTTVQRAVLELAASRPGGIITRWDVDGPRLRSLSILWTRGYLSNDGGWYTLTSKGREAIR